jgi:hypothetical protein
MQRDTTLTIDKHVKYGEKNFGTTTYTFACDKDNNMTETDISGWLPDCIDEYDTFKKEHNGITLLDNLIVYCGNIGNGTGEEFEISQSGTARLELIASRNLYPETLWSLCCKLYRRELFDNSAPIAENLKVSEDLLMAYSLYRNCKRIIVSDRAFYNYFRHGESVMAQTLNEKHIRDSMRAYQIIAEDMDKNTKAYEYHIQNLLSNDFGFLNSIILKNTCRECYGEIRKEILKYKKYAFINRDNPALNNRHRLGVILLSVCPKLFDLSIKIKG